METNRLIFRERTQAVITKLMNRSADEQMSFLGLETADTLEWKLSRIHYAHTNKRTEYKVFDLIKKDTKEVIGSCGFHNWYTEHDRAEVGYFLYDKFQNKGFMSEALYKVIQYGFSQMKLNRIEAFVGPDNIPSKRLMDKFNFNYEGLMREHYKHKDEIQDSIIYSLLKSEYNPVRNLKK